MDVKCTFTEIVDLDLLVPHTKNANQHSEQQIKLLAKIMKHQGWRHPIIVSNLSGFIVTGHARLASAKLNGWTQAPVDRQDFKNEADEYAHLISDNKLQELSETDLSMVLKDVLDLGPDFDFDLLGIPDFKLPEDFAPGCDEDSVPENVEPRTKLGDLYVLGNHRLLCGDSASIDAVEKLMNGEKADMVFTDPPYGVSYEKKTQEIANQSKTRHKSTIMNDDLTVDGLKDILSTAFSNIDLVLADKSCYYVCSPQGGELGLMMMMMQEANLICRHMIIWVKNAPVFSMNRLDYDYKHEPILFGWSKNRTHNKLMEGDFKNSVWEVAREPNKVHPTMKPVVLPENAIKNSCPHNGNVIDLFGGSGSTLIACEKTNRKCFMMELDPHYCDVIVARWEKYSGKKAVLES